MRADKKNLGTSNNFRLDVVTGSSVQVVRVTPRNQAGTEKGILDEIGGGIELRIARHVSFIHFATERLYIGPPLITQRDLLRRKRHLTRTILPQLSDQETPRSLATHPETTHH